MILSIDPGTRILSYALWDNMQLVHATAVRSTCQSLDERIRNMTRSMKDDLYLGGHIFDGNIEHVVVEKPVVYPFKNRIGDANDLIDVAMVGGYAAGAFRNTHVRFVKPDQWKGQKSKKVTKNLITRELDLQETENLLRGIEAQHVPAKLQHNVMDAVGIGLWYTGRVKR